jgi:hypothetical protein
MQTMISSYEMVEQGLCARAKPRTQPLFHFIEILQMMYIERVKKAGLY